MEVLAETFQTTIEKKVPPLNLKYKTIYFPFKVKFQISHSANSLFGGLSSRLMVFMVNGYS